MATGEPDLAGKVSLYRLVPESLGRRLSLAGFRFLCRMLADAVDRAALIALDRARHQ